jgi:hypothetical protein
MSNVGKVLAIGGGIAVAAGIIWWLYQQQAQAVTPVTPTPTPPTPPTPTTHYDCVKDKATGLIMCGEVEGAGVNQCDPYAPPDACWDKVSCSSQADCGTGARCWGAEPPSAFLPFGRKGKCYWTANEYLNYEGAIVRTTRFTFEKRVIGNKLFGDIGFKLGAPNVGCDPHVWIYVIRDGKRVKTIYDKKHEGMPWTWTDPAYRTDTFAVFMEAEAADGIEIECKCERGFPWNSFSDVLTKVHAQYMFV